MFTSKLIKTYIFFSFILFLGNCKVFATNTSNDTIPTPKLLSNLKNTFKKKRNEVRDSTIITQNNKRITLTNSLKKRDSITKVLKKSVKANYWTIINKPGVILTQTSFVNWTKGGNNTIAGIASFKGDYNYKKGLLFWKNGINIRYGLSKENGEEYTQKTDDIIDLKSSVGYKTNVTSKWYYSGEYNLTTQFADGFKGNNRNTIISTFFAPARMRLGIGAVYTDNDDIFKLHISPLTNQITFVLDRELSKKGAFGVEKGKKINSELGTLIRLEYKAQLMKNIDFLLKSSFYSDYINKFGNVDSDIEVNLNMKVNEYIHSTISSHLIYDDDAKILQEDGSQIGPKAQLKQILGVGVTYEF